MMFLLAAFLAAASALEFLAGFNTLGTIDGIVALVIGGLLALDELIA